MQSCKSSKGSFKAGRDFPSAFWEDEHLFMSAVNHELKLLCNDRVSLTTSTRLSLLPPPGNHPFPLKQKPKESLISSFALTGCILITQLQQHLN